MFILGISAFYRDSAACIVRDGRLLPPPGKSFTRKKA